jgi:L-fucose isomerase-like protein
VSNDDDMSLSHQLNMLNYHQSMLRRIHRLMNNGKMWQEIVIENSLYAEFKYHCQEYFKMKHGIPFTDRMITVLLNFYHYDGGKMP